MLNCTAGIMNHIGKDAIVGDHEESLGCLNDQGSTLAPHAGIDNHQMDGAGREIAVVAGEDESRLGDLLGLDIVAEIHYPDLGVYAVYHPFHHPYIAVLHPEIGGQSYEPRGLQICLLV